MKHQANCHCGTVKFEFNVADKVTMTRCNCSICSMSGYQHIFIPQTDLQFISGEDALTLYTFGSHAAKHMFCKICGVKPLYIPRSHPDSYSVNLRCIIKGALDISEVIEFDGQNWEKNISSLRKAT